MAGYDIGPKIGIDGEAEFRKSVQGINTTIKTLGTELGLVASQFDKNDKSEKALSAQNEVLTKQYAAQKERLDELRKGLEASRDKYGENDAVTQKWQQTVNKAETELNNLGRTLGENEKDLEAAKKGLNSAERGANDYGNTAEKAEKKTGGLGESLKKMGDIAGKAVAVMGAAAAAAGGALVAASVSGAAYADTILTQSAQTSIATDKLQEYKYAAELVDVPVETLTKSLAKNTKSMLSAQQGSKNFKDAYDKLGVSFENSDGSLRDGQTVYWELIDALGQVENETERDAMAMQLLGKSAQDLNPLIEAGSERMEELGKQARDAGYVMSGETLAAFGAFDDQIQYLKVGAEGAKNALGTLLLPMLTTLATDGVELLGDFTKGIQGADGDIGKMGDVVARTLESVVGKLAEYLPQVVDAGVKIVGAIGRGILGNLPAIINSAVTLVKSLAGGLIGALPLLVDGALQLVSALASGIGEALPVLIPAAVAAVVAIVQGLIDNIPSLLDGALQLVIGLVQGLIAAIPVLIEAVPTIITSLVTALLESIPQIIQAGIDLIVSLVGALPEIIATIVGVMPQIIDGVVAALLENIPLIVQAGIDLLVALIQALPQIITTLVAAAPKIISSVINALVNNIPLIIQAGVQLFVALIQNLPTIIVEIVKAVPQIVSGIVQGFTGSAGEIVNVGKNIITGVWDGIVGMGKWIKDKVAGFFGGIVDNVKGLLGIRSPSRVFAGIGEYMAQGIGVGFEDQVGGIKRSLGASMASMMPAMPNLDVPQASYIRNTTVRLDATTLVEAMSGMAVTLDGRKVGRFVIGAQRTDARTQLKPQMS